MMSWQLGSINGLDRNRHGGGVLIYVNSCFSVKVLLSAILS